MSNSSDKRGTNIGRLIFQGRRRSCKSTETCAAALGLERADYEAIESGERQPSLPELEVLAMYLDLPLAYFWGAVKLDEEVRPDFEGYLTIRHVIIGTTLRQYREEQKMSLEELAQKGRLSPQSLEAYESGEQIPIYRLGRTLQALNHTLKDVIDDARGPLAQHELDRDQKDQFSKLPDEIKAFVADPLNLGFLESAMHLSRLDADALRAIAESLLEITY